MVYKHAYLNTLLFLHFAFMLRMAKMPLKVEVGGRAINSHGNCIFDHGKSLNNHGIVFLNFCGSPVLEDLKVIRHFLKNSMPYALVQK